MDLMVENFCQSVNLLISVHFSVRSVHLEALLKVSVFHFIFPDFSETSLPRVKNTHQGILIDVSQVLLSINADLEECFLTMI